MKKIVAILLLLPTFCFAEKVQLKGTVLFGPEAMYFKKCGSEEKWWLGSYTFKAEGWQEVEKELDSQPLCDLSTMPCKHQSVEISGIAGLSVRGEYGHLGQYPHQVYFTKISLEQGGACDI